VGPIHNRRRPSSAVHGKPSGHPADDEMHALLGTLLAQKRAMHAQAQAQAAQFVGSPPPTPGSMLDQSLSSLCLGDLSTSELMALIKQEHGVAGSPSSASTSAPLVFQSDAVMTNCQPMPQRHGSFMMPQQRTGVLHSNSVPMMVPPVMGDCTPLITPTSLDEHFILDSSFISSLSVDEVLALSDQFLATSAATGH
jgi:hypothetical protein